MMPSPVRFGDFTLDPANRMLMRGDARVDLPNRYLDALILLVAEAGSLVAKERFLEEVWHGVPVTDEALTQGIRTLRRELGDSATTPRFIETVPKHGYRFIAEVTGPTPSTGDALPRATSAAADRRANAARLFVAGTLGAGVAGVIGGLLYGMAFTAVAAGQSSGAFSAVLVVTCLTIALTLVGGGGVSAGIAAADAGGRTGAAWFVAGGAAGGLATGAIVRLLGIDAFALLFGIVPAAMTGAFEGLLLGAAAGAAAWVALHGPPGASYPRLAALGALAGASAGVAIGLTGGRLMGGSLDLLVRVFPGSRLRLDGVAASLGEDGFGPVSTLATAMAEGALFCACIACAVRFGRPRRPVARATEDAISGPRGARPPRIA